jgi:hypothetical protein
MRLVEFGFAQLGSFAEASVGRMYPSYIVGVLHIGDLTVPIHKHVLIRSQERKVSVKAIDIILKKLPQISEKIKFVDPGTKFWVYDSSIKQALGFLKLDSGAIQLTTVLDKQPHLQGKYDILNVNEETLNAIPTA